MYALRTPFAAVGGALCTASMFWLLWSFIETSFEAGERVEAPRIELLSVRRETEAATKRDEKVERERPPPTPETPRLALSNGNVENTVARISPVVDARGAASRMTMVAGSDRDVIPLVRINPTYPPGAATRGIEGWVQVQFTITAIGTVKDPVVVNAVPKNVFDDAALKAIARWRYNPKIESGVAVQRVGVQARIVFELEE